MYEADLSYFFNMHSCGQFQLQKTASTLQFWFLTRNRLFALVIIAFHHKWHEDTDDEKIVNEMFYWP